MKEVFLSESGSFASLQATAKNKDVQSKPISKKISKSFDLFLMLFLVIVHLSNDKISKCARASTHTHC